MYHRLLLLFCCLCMAQAGVAQTQPFCGSSAYQARLQASQPILILQEERINALLKAETEALGMQRTTTDTVHYVIPIVYHILHDSGPENLSDALVRQDVDNINDAFANVGYYDPTTGAPVDISFCLASRGKFGEPHDGIDHIEDDRFLTIDYTGNEEVMKTSYHWPSDKVLNVYTVRDIAFAEAYATFPTMDETNPQDGVVIKADFIGTTEAGSAVMAHEIGHWLGLYHTFQNGCPNADCLLSGDMVCDTPPDTDTTVYEGCSLPHNNCDTDADDPSDNNPFLTDVPDMHNNYMDYNFESCYKAFSEGQRTRMRLALRLFRPGILRSEYCQPTTQLDASVYSVRRPSGLACTFDSIRPRIRLQNFSPTYLTQVDLQYWVDSGDTMSYRWTGQIGPGGSARYIDLPAMAPAQVGAHTFTVQTLFPNSLTDQFPNNDQLTVRFEVLGSARLPFVEDFEEGLPATWTPINGLGESWQTSVTAGCQPGDAENLALNVQTSFYHSPSTNIYFTPVIDLALEPAATLTFDRAYRRAAGLSPIQTLRIKVIEACDTSRATEVYVKSQNQISGPFLRDKSITWVPESCNDWKTETVDLSEFEGKQVIIAFETDIGRGGYERLYLDNVQITSSRVAAQEIAGLMPDELMVYPVPSGGRLWVEFPMLWEAPVQISLSDAMGRLVYTSDYAVPWGWFKEELDLRRLASGHYFLRLQIGEQVLMRKIALLFGLQE